MTSLSHIPFKAVSVAVGRPSRQRRKRSASSVTSCGASHARERLEPLPGKIGVEVIGLGHERARLDSGRDRAALSVSAACRPASSLSARM